MVELNPNVLSEFVLKNAKDWTEAEKKTFIAALRVERAKVNEAEAAGKAKPRSTIAAAERKALADSIKFEDLDLGI